MKKEEKEALDRILDFVVPLEEEELEEAIDVLIKLRNKQSLEAET